MYVFPGKWEDDKRAPDKIKCNREEEHFCPQWIADDIVTYSGSLYDSTFLSVWQETTVTAPILLLVILYT